MYVSLLDQLDHPPNMSVGHIQTATAALIWTTKRVELHRPGAHPEVISQGDLASVQVSRALRAPQSGWLRRLVRWRPKPEHWLHVELRSRRGRQRISLSAQANEAFVAGLPWLAKLGETFPLEEVSRIVDNARALGAHLAAWTEEDLTPPEDEMLPPREPKRPGEAGSVINPRPPIIIGENVLEEKDLGEAIFESQPKAVLELSAGRYYLEAPLLINKPLTLVGDHHSNTRIYGLNGPAVIRFEGTGPFELKNLSIVHASHEPADVIDVQGGQLLIKRCHIAGALQDPSALDKGGVGIRLRADSKTEINSCHLMEHDRSAMRVQNMAHATLLRNKCERNGDHGSEFCDGGQGSISGNACMRNGRSGIAVSTNAPVTIDNNRAFSNGQHGILVQGAGALTLASNSCEYNVSCGVAIEGQRHVNLEQQQAMRNEKHGVYALNDSVLNIVGGRFSSNTEAGIKLGDHVECMLFNSECRDNQGAAIEAVGLALVHLKKIKCRSNAWGCHLDDQAQVKMKDAVFESHSIGGICVEGHGEVVAQACRFSSNTYAGVVLRGQARGKIEDSQCTRNGSFGVEILDEAKLEFKKNTCDYNRSIKTETFSAGIRIVGHARGIFIDNRCIGNDMGVWIGDDAAPTLENNTCQTNREAGFGVGQRAAPTLTANPALRNAGPGMWLRDHNTPHLQARRHSDTPPAACLLNDPAPPITHA